MAEGLGAIGYGFPIASKNLDPEDEMFEDSGLIVGSSGDGYSKQQNLLLVEESEASCYSWEGKATKLPADKLVVKSNWNQLLQDFCTKNKIKYKEPSWYLCGSIF